MLTWKNKMFICVEIQKFKSQRKSFTCDRKILHHLKISEQENQETFQDPGEAEYSWDADLVGSRLVGSFYLIVNNTMKSN